MCKKKEKVPINTNPKMQCICLYVFDFRFLDLLCCEDLNTDIPHD